MKIRKRMNRLHKARSVMLAVFTLTLFGSILFALCHSVDAATRYAKSGGPSPGTCGSWAAACDLQYAISQSGSGDEIWVKAGTYLTTPGTDRTISFSLKNGVAIYGGFTGTETERGQRSPETNVTILSGDIGMSGDAADNSYHVAASTGVDNSAILDGFIITAGNANGAPPHGSGGGIRNESSSPTLRNITFIDNAAGLDGGGMYNNASSPSLSNITFINNTAGLQGGGIYNLKSSPVLTNVSFSGNTAGLEGGGIYNLLSSPTLNNVTFSGNSSEIEGFGADNLCSGFVIATTTTLTSSPNPSGYGTSVDFTATVNASSTPTGTVTFKDGATTLSTAALNGTGQAAFSTSALAAGNHTITAVYSGDWSFGGSTSDPLAQTVNKSGTTTAIASHTPDPSTVGQAVTVNFSATSTAGTPTGNVTVSDGTVNCTATVAAGSCSLTFTSAGSKTLAATYAGDANFSSSASAGVSHTVNKAATITIVVNTPSPSIFGQTVTFTATVSSGAGTPTGIVTFSEETTTYCSSVSLNGSGQAACSTSSLSAGSHTITATYSGNGNYNGSSGTVGQTVNASPTITSGDSTSFSIGGTGSFTVTTTGYPVPSISSSGSLPVGLSFTDNNNGTAALGGTPAARSSGQYPLTFTASNGVAPNATQNFTITIANNPPVLDPIGNKEVNEGETLRFIITASDPDGDTLTYDAGNLPTGATFDKTTQTFQWTPGYDQAGSYQNVLFTVTDDGAPMASDFEEITITVGNVNRPPVLDFIGSKQAYEGQLLQFTITASDPDGDGLIYDAGNLPAGASFDKDTQTFTWTPTYAQAGNYTGVLFTVTDNWTSPLSASEAITITVSNVNRPPVLNPIGDRTVKEKETLTFTVTAIDPDGDALAYSAGNLPAGAIFDPVGQTFTWIPNYDQAGNYGDVRFTVTDNIAPPESDTKAITITVGNVNRPPVLAPIGSKTVTAGEPLEFVITATDPDGDALTYSASNLPLGATFDPAGQKFSWTPTNDQGGIYPNIEFTVTDNGSPTELDFEVIEITVGNVNRPPVFTPVGSQSTLENQLLQFYVTATDPDGNPITYSTGPLPSGAFFNASTRLFSWRPESTQAGAYTIVFYASDNGSPSMTGQLEVAIIVGDVPTRCELSDRIIQTVIGLRLPKSVENAYMANLKKVCGFVEEGKITPAVNQLEAFINKVRTDIAKGKIAEVAGNNLINMALDLINLLRS